MAGRWLAAGDAALFGTLWLGDEAVGPAGCSDMMDRDLPCLGNGLLAAPAKAAEVDCGVVEAEGVRL